MARFMTREVEGIFKKLRNEVEGSSISVSLGIETWSYSHDRDDKNVALQIGIQSKVRPCQIFFLCKYSSLEVMVEEALAKIREWKEVGK